jgi:hypothetical protein
MHFSSFGVVIKTEISRPTRLCYDRVLEPLLTDEFARKKEYSANTMLSLASSVKASIS